MIFAICLIVTHLIAFYLGFVYRMNHMVKTTLKNGTFSERYAVSKLQKKREKRTTE